MESPYMYIFVRTDLSIPQQIVQVGHAAEGAGRRFPCPGQTSNMVLFGVDGEEELKKVAYKLSMHGIDFQMFYEPDITSHTALVTRPLFGEERKPLKRYKLLK